MTSPNNRTRRRRGAFAALACIALAGAAAASAASLNGITSDKLGADATLVASCDIDGVTATTFVNAYDATLGAYKTSGVTIGGIDAACAGETMKVTLKDGTGAGLGEATATVAGASQAVTFAPTIDAELVQGVAVVITGA